MDVSVYLTSVWCDDMRCSLQMCDIIQEQNANTVTVENKNQRIMFSVLLVNYSEDNV